MTELLIRTKLQESTRSKLSQRSLWIDLDARAAREWRMGSRLEASKKDMHNHSRAYMIYRMPPQV